MRFLGDMDISSGVIQWLRDQGHDATHLREQNLKRLPDGEIFHKADAENRIILTCDLGFGEILALSGTQTVSAVVFRDRNKRTAHLIARLQRVLEDSAQDLEDGAIISVGERGHRVRLLPIGREK
jgi:predicted nuclease of predicted toxin-antitoxin system